MATETPEVQELARLMRIPATLVVEVMEVFQHCDPYLNRHDVIINPLCHIGCIDSVTIGDFVVLSERCLVIDHTHGDVSYEHLSLYERERPLVSKGKVVIEDYVWMGENSVVMSGVTVGHNSLIGANAVVTKDIPPYSIVAGNPARILRTLEPPTKD